MKRIVTIEVIAILFVVLFVYAAASKLLDYEKFTIQIGQSPMLSGIAGIIAWFIPSVELMISFLLIMPTTRVIGFFGAFGLMLSFTTYIIVVTNFSQFVPCSCGGVLQNMSWSQHLIFNIFFVFLALAGIVLLAPSEQTQLKKQKNTDRQ